MLNMYFLLFKNLSKSINVDIDINNQSVVIGNHQYNNKKASNEIFLLTTTGVVFDTIRKSAPKFQALDGLVKKSSSEWDNVALPGKNLKQINMDRAIALLSPPKKIRHNLSQITFDLKNVAKQVATDNKTVIQWDGKVWYWEGEILPKFLERFQTLDAEIEYFLAVSDETMARYHQYGDTFNPILDPTFSLDLSLTPYEYIRISIMQIVGSEYEEVVGFDIEQGDIRVPDNTLFAAKMLAEKNIDCLAVFQLENLKLQFFRYKTGEIVVQNMSNLIDDAIQIKALNRIKVVVEVEPVEVEPVEVEPVEVEPVEVEPVEVETKNKAICWRPVGKSVTFVTLNTYQNEDFDIHTWLGKARYAYLLSHNYIVAELLHPGSQRHDHAVEIIKKFQKENPHCDFSFVTVKLSPTKLEVGSFSLDSVTLECLTAIPPEDPQRKIYDDAFDPKFFNQELWDEMEDPTSGIYVAPPKKRRAKLYFENPTQYSSRILCEQQQQAFDDCHPSEQETVELKLRHEIQSLKAQVEALKTELQQKDKALVQSNENTQEMYNLWVIASLLIIQADHNCDRALVKAEEALALAKRVKYNTNKELEKIIAKLIQEKTDIKTRVGNFFKSERSAKGVRTRMINTGKITEQDAQKLIPTQVDGGWVLRKNI